MTNAKYTPHPALYVWAGLICLSVGGVLLPQVFLGLIGMLLVPAGFALSLVGLLRAQRAGRPDTPGFGTALPFACGAIALVLLGSTGTELLVEVQDARSSQEQRRRDDQFSQFIGAQVQPSAPVKEPPSRGTWITWSAISLAAGAAIAFALHGFTGASPLAACRRGLVAAAISPVALFGCSAVFGVVTRT